MSAATHLNAERTQKMAAQQVCATPEAVEAIVRLHAELGNFVLRHVAGEVGAPEVRLVRSTAQCGGDDVALGTVGGVLFVIDRHHDLALGCPDFHVDVTPTRLHNDETGVRAQYHLISRAVHRR
jgi:uncharacterized protein (DUF779 family)